MEEVSLMLTARQDRAHSGDGGRASARGDHEDMPGVQALTQQLCRQELPSLVDFSVSLDESQVFPFPLLSDPYRTKRCLPAQKFAPHLEVGPIHDEVSDLHDEGPVQPPNQRRGDCLVHSTSPSRILGPSRTPVFVDHWEG